MKKLLVPFFLSLDAAACLPFGAAAPTTTFEPGKPDVPCTAPPKPEHDGVVSVVGCQAKPLDRCRAGETDLARDLEGECTGATHVARGGKLVALSLGDFRVTGTYHGVMSQPNGPYESYDMTLWLAQDGQRVTGVTRLSTPDDKYFGDFHVEGRVEGNVIYLGDTELLDENLPFYLEWCSKSGYLFVDPKDGHLTGPWRAPWCHPGTLDAKRVEDHPRVIIPGRAAHR